MNYKNKSMKKNPKTALYVMLSMIVALVISCAILIGIYSQNSFTSIASFETVIMALLITTLAIGSVSYVFVYAKPKIGKILHKMTSTTIQKIETMSKETEKELETIRKEILSVRRKFLVIGVLTILGGIVLFFSPLPPLPFNILTGLCIVGLGLYLMS